MSVNFKVSGPYQIPFNDHPSGKGKRIERDHVAMFWKGEAIAELSEKQGCYIFALSVSGSFIPWYVGKTKNRMKDECFNPSNIEKYNNVIFSKKGKPVMFLVTRKSGKRIVPKQDLSQLEIYLIQAAKLRNDNLINNHHTRNLPTWSIAGVVRGKKGEGSAVTTKFKRMLAI